MTTQSYLSHTGDLMKVPGHDVPDDLALLKLAAQALGIYDLILFSDVHGTAYWYERYRGDWGEHDGDAVWNPLTSDGDCARLESVLGITLQWAESGVFAACKGFGWGAAEYRVPEARDEARRRASVLCAARVAQSKPVPA